MAILEADSIFRFSIQRIARVRAFQLVHSFSFFFFFFFPGIEIVIEGLFIGKTSCLIIARAASEDEGINTARPEILKLYSLSCDQLFNIKLHSVWSVCMHHAHACAIIPSTFPQKPSAAPKLHPARFRNASFLPARSLSLSHAEAAAAAAAAHVVGHSD
jgi:hypothetical protein